jgi:GNAT superfamily N-acetyltransferase
MSEARIVKEDKDGTHAGALFNNYRRLFIGDQVVGGILELARDWQRDCPGATAAFVQKRRRWESQGGFLETISTGDVSFWVNSPLHIVVDAPAPVSTSTEDGLLEPVAQILYQLPERDWIVPTLLDPADKIIDRDLHAELVSAGPESSVATDYLAVLPEWAGNGLGAAVRSAGALRCARLNAERGADAQIRFVVGWTFAIQALEVFDPEERSRFGNMVRLRSYRQGEIVNRMSLRTYLRRQKVPTHLVGKWRTGRPVPIVVLDRPYALHVHWYCLVQRLADFVRASTA